MSPLEVVRAAGSQEKAPGLATFRGENHLEAPGGAVWFRKQGKVMEVGGGRRGALGPHLYPLPRDQGSLVTQW